jgi:hypothetical protein
VPTKKEKQPLSVTHPELAKEADGWDPSENSLIQGRKVGWRCSFGHHFETSIYNRVARNRGCPYCAGQKVLPGFNDLQSRFPEIADEAFGWDPSLVAKSSSKKLSWKCSQGHQYEAAVSTRSSGRGCPICSGRKVLKGFNDLQTTHPEIAIQAEGWDPAKVSRGSNEIKRWKCINGHTWATSTNKRTGEKTGCPVCSNHKVLAGENDLLTTHPELASQMIDDDPSSYVAGSEKKVQWTCELGHVYKSSVANRVNGSGCLVCVGRQVLPGFNDLAFQFPEIAAEAYEWDPKTVTPSSHLSLNWKCPEGHIYKRQVANRTSRPNRCPICSGHKVQRGFNDLETTHPEIAIQAEGWDPKTVTAGSGKKLSWRCHIGHTYFAQISNKTTRGDQCPICSGNQILIGFNDLQTTHPKLCLELVNPLDGFTLSSGSDKKLEWICPNQHKWKASVANRKAGNGCPSCTKAGFDPNSDAYLYFLIHRTWDAFQIGITNHPEDRLKVHKNLGWETIEVRGPMDGHLTQQWETAILRMLKAKGADLSNSRIAGKFDGYSEAWSKSTFEAKSIKELMWLTEEFESLG